MLRMLIWADKSKKKLIIKRHEMNNKDRKERLLAEKTMEIDKEFVCSYFKLFLVLHKL